MMMFFVNELFCQRDCPPLAANVFQAGVGFLLVQVMHLSVNTQKITLAWC